MSISHGRRDFSTVGGLHQHINSLKELVIYPLLYSEVFELNGIKPPRGVLFYGPPGTGKTLVAGALAEECSKTGKRVHFFQRKGADCLDKFIGESEKILKELFETAQSMSPSIIFFDEIDGLAPTRNAKQEIHHASVVTTLLALMDGLDAKSQLFIIGATNRIDMIDPALRRPGRFDRELYFPLPSLEAREEILKIHTSSWKPVPGPEQILKLASACVGYCGADIQSLCSQACIQSFRRTFPQVADTSKKHMVRCRSLHVSEEDFEIARSKMIPASQRICASPSRQLPPETEPLLRHSIAKIIDFIKLTSPFKFLFPRNDNLKLDKNCIRCPRLLLYSSKENCLESLVAPAVLHYFDHLPVTTLELQYCDRWNNSTISKARESMPSILYLPDVITMWNLLDGESKHIVIREIKKFDNGSDTKLFILATATCYEYEALPESFQELFSKSSLFEFPAPSKEDEHSFLSSLIVDKTILPPSHKTNSCDIDLPEDEQRRKRLRGELVVHMELPYERISYSSFFPHNSRKRNIKGTFIKAPEAIENIETPHTSGESGDSKNIVGVSVPDLKSLVDRITSHSATVKQLMNLYGRLEITSMKFSSKWDRTDIVKEFKSAINSWEINLKSRK